MASYVLTLIGHAESNPLEQGHIKTMCDHLAVKGRQIWLAENEACDVFFSSPQSTSKLCHQARDALLGTSIDVACTPAENRRKKLLISDMDSTVINQECIDELGDAYGVGDRIREITAEVIDGSVSFSDALRQRMALMKGLDYTLLEKIYEDRISLKGGACTLVQTMRKHGAQCILVSGGFSFFTSRIAARIGFHNHQANELIIKNGVLTGAVREPILGRTAKLEILNRLCEEFRLKPQDVVAVGDGANDIRMIEAAGLGVAFHASDSLKEYASSCIDHNDLTSLLYIQGFSKSEFVVG